MSRVRRQLWPVAALAGAVLAVYGRVYTHGFIDYDDPSYVSENPFVLHGLTLDGVRWAFTTGHMGNWNPLTWLSHMLDVQLFGPHPGAHHLVNVAWHLANTLLLFAVLQRMTRAPWPSLAVAALFAVHPLHVESVAWIAERKDVLSTCFWLLTLWAYAHYAETRAWRWYAATLALFAGGLMAKPMLVTVPFVLLLLDIWPLGRLALPGAAAPAAASAARRRDAPRHDRRARGRGAPAAGASDADSAATSLAALLWEKAPFFAVSVAASAVAYAAQRASGAIDQSGRLPLGVRVANGLVAYVRYLIKAVWPANLAVIYPYAALPLWQPVAAAVGLAAVSLLVLRGAARHPYALVGWLWYLGTLVPVIGLVQIGSQAFADRYTYVPLIGIFIMLAWGGRALVARWALPAPAVAAAVTATVVAYAALAWAQVGLWQSSETLLAHATQVTRDNCIAHNNLGIALAAQGKTDAALEQYRTALRIKSDYGDPYNNIGLILAQQGRYDEAAAQYRTALQYGPESAETHNNLGLALRDLGRTDEAVAELAEAVRLEPAYAYAHNNLGNALRATGHAREAVEHYAEALRLRPDYVEAHSNLAVALRDLGRPQEAIEQCQQAVRLNPAYPDAYNNLGNALRDTGRLPEAIEQYQHALALKPDYASAHDNLGSVLAETGRRQEAIEHLQQALAAQPDDAVAHNNLGLVLSQLGRPEEAIAQLAEAIRIEPNYAGAHANLGNALRATGRVDEAIAQYREALRLEPDDANARQGLGTALLGAGRLPEAIEQLAQDAARRPNDVTAHYNLAGALARGGRLPEAIDQYRAVLRLAPDDAEAWSNLAFAYAEAGQSSEAIEAARTASATARSTGQADLMKTIDAWLTSYTAGRSGTGTPARGD